jgi:quercetin dioxygenase-like cupin family protein
MIVSHEKEVMSDIIDSPDVKNAAMKVLIGQEQGWADHVMRVIELEPDGYSPKHTHSWPHINFMIEGSGVLMIEGQDYPVKQGSYAFVPANANHQFKNTGSSAFRFICIVPKEGHQ